MIVCIGGGPRRGKTQIGEMLALRSGTELLRTDDRRRAFDHLPEGDRWSAASQDIAARILTARNDLIVEGVVVWRALRKALAQSAGRPCDRIIAVRSLLERLTAESYAAALRRDPSIVLTSRQAGMAKGCDKVLAEILPELRRRGVVVEVA